MNDFDRCSQVVDLWTARRHRVAPVLAKTQILKFYQPLVGNKSPSRESFMVGEMVQNSQSLYSFTFNAVIVIHEYIYSHSTTNFTLKKYIYSHLTMYFLFTNIFTHIYEIYSFTFNRLYSFTFTIEIFIQHFLRTTFAHH